MKFLLFITYLSVTISGNCQLKIDYKHFYDLLTQKKYGTVFREAQIIFQEPYGKTPFVKYLLAKSLCGDNYQERGISMYDDILQHYALNSNDSIFISTEKKRCQIDPAINISTSSSTELETLVYLNSLQNNRSGGVGGKMGYADCSKLPEFIKIVDTISLDEFNSRLFTIENKSEALKKMQDLVGSQHYTVEFRGRFIFVSKVTNQYVINYKKMTENLEQVYQFYYMYYGIRPPDKLITVYFVPDKQSLQELALRIHGIRLPYTFIGYSNALDLSIVGIGDNDDNIGTFKHELFHLMVRTDLGDIPTWLDEGLACLYETSKFKNDTLIGLSQNWRTDVLEDFSHFFDLSRNATIAELINYSPIEFEGKLYGEYCVGSYNYALAKHFIIYAQELGCTQKLVSNFKNRNNYLFDTNNQWKSDIELVEEAFNSDIISIQKSFSNWLKEKYKVTLWGYYTSSFNISKEIQEYFNTIDSLIFSLDPQIKKLNAKIELYDSIPKYHPNEIAYNAAKRMLVDYKYLVNKNTNIRNKYFETYSPNNQKNVDQNNTPMNKNMIYEISFIVDALDFTMEALPNILYML